jgi:hypothetical protein
MILLDRDALEQSLWRQKANFPGGLASIPRLMKPGCFICHAFLNPIRPSRPLCTTGSMNDRRGTGIRLTHSMTPVHPPRWAAWPAAGEIGFSMGGGSNRR